MPQKNYHSPKTTDVTASEISRFKRNILFQKKSKLENPDRATSSSSSVYSERLEGRWSSGQDDESVISSRKKVPLHEIHRDRLVSYAFESIDKSYSVGFSFRREIMREEEGKGAGDGTEAPLLRSIFPKIRGEIAPREERRRFPELTFCSA